MLQAPVGHLLYTLLCVLERLQARFEQLLVESSTWFGHTRACCVYRVTHSVHYSAPTQLAPNVHRSGFFFAIIILYLRPVHPRVGFDNDNGNGNGDGGGGGCVFFLHGATHKHAHFFHPLFRQFNGTLELFSCCLIAVKYCG